MSNVINAAPQAILEGIEDVSGQTVDSVPEALAIHTPHVMILAQRGRADAQFVDSVEASRIFGAETFNVRSKYFTHATALLKTSIFANANKAIVQRVTAPDAKKATLGFYLDLLPTEVPLYQRDATGALVLDTNGDKIPTGSTVSGFIGKWGCEQIEGRELKAAKTKIGTQTDAHGNQSTRWPIFDLEVDSVGNYGNNVGVRLWAPTISSSTPANEELNSALKAFIYRLQLVERSTTTSTPTVSRTLYDEMYVNFGLKEGLYHDATSTEYHLNDVYLPSYESDDDTSGVAPTYAPFGKFYVYQKNVDAITALLLGTEKAYGYGDEEGYLINLLTGLDIDNNPYYTYQVAGALEGGLGFSESTTYYALGGSDGTLDEDTFDTLVREEFLAYGEKVNQFLDIARFPQSIIYDSGFTMATKKALYTPLGLRKDIALVVATQDVSLEANDAATESSMALALRTHAEMFPESSLYGTGVARVAIVGHAGYLANSEYKKLVPGTFEIADKLAKWAGSSEGVLKSRYSPDVSPNNKLRLLKKVNCTFRTSTVRNKDWNNGLIWAQSYDMNSLFFPALQTAYGDDTSVLNSLLNVLICVECQKVCFRVWRDMVGRTDLTNAQYIKRSDELIAQHTANRFGDRAVVVPNTYLTKADTQRGFSNHAKLKVYLNNMKTVTSFTVSSYRMEDLNNG